MPRKVHVRRWKPGTGEALTREQKWELILGQRTAGRSAFASDEERRLAWEEHRDAITMPPTMRAWAWWRYEAPEPRDHGPGQGDAAQLARLGLLTDEERELAAKWHAARGAA
jgi:hypothetical protein